MKSARFLEEAAMAGSSSCISTRRYATYRALNDRQRFPRSDLIVVDIRKGVRKYSGWSPQGAPAFRSAVWITRSACSKQAFVRLAKGGNPNLAELMHHCDFCRETR